MDTRVENTVASAREDVGFVFIVCMSTLDASTPLTAWAATVSASDAALPLDLSLAARRTLNQVRTEWLLREHVVKGQHAFSWLSRYIEGDLGFRVHYISRASHRTAAVVGEGADAESVIAPARASEAARSSVDAAAAFVVLATLVPRVHRGFDVTWFQVRTLQRYFTLIAHDAGRDPDVEDGGGRVSLLALAAAVLCGIAARCLSLEESARLLSEELEYLAAISNSCERADALNRRLRSRRIALDEYAACFSDWTASPANGSTINETPVGGGFAPWKSSATAMIPITTLLQLRAPTPHTSSSNLEQLIARAGATSPLLTSTGNSQQTGGGNTIQGVSPNMRRRRSSIVPSDAANVMSTEGLARSTNGGGGRVRGLSSTAQPSNQPGVDSAGLVDWRRVQWSALRGSADNLVAGLYTTQPTQQSAGANTSSGGGDSPGRDFLLPGPSSCVLLVAPLTASAAEEGTPRNAAAPLSGSFAGEPMVTSAMSSSASLLSPTVVPLSSPRHQSLSSSHASVPLLSSNNNASHHNNQYLDWMLKAALSSAIRQSSTVSPSAGGQVIAVGEGKSPPLSSTPAAPCARAMSAKEWLMAVTRTACCVMMPGSAFTMPVRYYIRHVGADAKHRFRAVVPAFIAIAKDFDCARIGDGATVQSYGPREFSLYVSPRIRVSLKLPPETRCALLAPHGSAHAMHFSGGGDASSRTGTARTDGTEVHNARRLQRSNTARFSDGDGMQPNDLSSHGGSTRGGGGTGLGQQGDRHLASISIRGAETSDDGDLAESSGGIQSQRRSDAYKKRRRGRNKPTDNGAAPQDSQDGGASVEQVGPTGACCGGGCVVM